jgi:hypothetical protein
MLNSNYTGTAAYEEGKIKHRHSAGTGTPIPARDCAPPPKSGASAFAGGGSQQADQSK